MEEFYQKAIPRECLPSDFGGTLPSIDELHEEFKNEYYRLRDFFRAEEEQRGLYWDELQMKKKQKPEPEIIQNFSKLDID